MICGLATSSCALYVLHKGINGSNVEIYYKQPCVYSGSLWHISCSMIVNFVDYYFI